MNHQNKAEGPLESLFRTIGQRMDDLISEVPKDKESFKSELHKRSDELKRNLHFLEMKVDEFAINHQSTIQEVEDKVRESKEKIKKEFSNFRDHLKDKK
ncbi:hypothetical protein [Persicobacter psychrovividus]|uniref:Uncharacterized protein n=1 Tax=Persicobacter psychrovividus TaxID=387638 RepID=A0ABM7VBB2_9BACT|nr:hypothetical protein PEPS_04990 [Persicobacter psychrovividus]